MSDRAEQEQALVQFRRSPVLHIDGGHGTALCGRTGPSAAFRGYVRDHHPLHDKPICKRCQRIVNPNFDDLAREGGI